MSPSSRATEIRLYPAILFAVLGRLSNAARSEISASAFSLFAAANQCLCFIMSVDATRPPPSIRGPMRPICAAMLPDEAGPGVIERSAMPDSPERLHAQIQASIPAELHGIRRAAERRAPEAG